eukprot:TRINITY_DN2397_c0_g1_i1.p1 TRINITY_DN2397_c0_g1~~TRINITY_DN2397_c0_g1_i1.p1  ORF type:complete len:380 (-),score=104.29 TRINITY_DN2397_c0_g1_i1:104-1243(-)
MSNNRTPNTLMVATALVLLMVTACIAVVDSASVPLNARIELDELALQKGALVMRTIVTLAENEHREVSVLTWDSPLDASFGARSFVVQKDGANVQYTGPVAKRLWSVLHEPSHYVTFSEAKPTTESFVRLDRDFDLGEGGSFEIKLVAKFYHHKIAGEEAIEGELKEIVVESNTVRVSWYPSHEVEEEDELARSRKLYHMNRHKRDVVASYDTCTATQKATCAKALVESGKMADAMYADARSTSSKAHQTFFGTQPSASSSVSKTISNIRGAQSGAEIVLFCAPDRCNQGVIAYVYPVYPLDVYLCGTFWQLETAGGYDTQAGSLIHELSHFIVVGGTQDYIYGPQGAQSLALSDATKAQKNADNFEYYGESIYPVKTM